MSIGSDIDIGFSNQRLDPNLRIGSSLELRVKVGCRNQVLVRKLGPSSSFGSHVSVECQVSRSTSSFELSLGFKNRIKSQDKSQNPN